MNDFSKIQTHLNLTFSVSKKLIINGGAIRPIDLLFLNLPESIKHTNLHYNYILTPPPPYSFNVTWDTFVIPATLQSSCLLYAPSQMLFTFCVFLGM